MPRFTIPRADAVDLVFDGVLLADVSSREGNQARWTEHRIYRTDSGRYVTERVGRTTVPGEHDFLHVHVWDNPADVRKGFERPHKRGTGVYLTDLAFEAMEHAAAVDPALNLALEERI